MRCFLFSLVSVLVCGLSSSALADQVTSTSATPPPLVSSMPTPPVVQQDMLQAWQVLPLSERRTVVQAWQALPETTRPVFPLYREQYLVSRHSKTAPPAKE